MKNIHIFDDLPTWEKLQKKMTVGQLPDFHGMKILDFGSGSGKMAAYYASDNDVTAVEPDKELFEMNAVLPYQQICGDISALNMMADESFDVILCHNVLEYTDERETIIREFQRLLKDCGMLSVVKHNKPGRVFQMAVLLNDFTHADELLNGKNGNAEKYGVIRYYEDEELMRWAAGLKLHKVFGMRVFWDLQQDQTIQTEPRWQEKMLALERQVEEIEPYRNAAFFHHLIIMKR